MTLKSLKNNSKRPSNNATKPRPEFGQRLKAAREKHGLSQADLSKQVGWVSNTTISKYELGTSEPSLEDIGRLASALGVYPEVLAFGADTIAQHIHDALNSPVATSGDHDDIDLIGRIQSDLEQLRQQQKRKRE